jgi:hypothetical protein
VREVGETQPTVEDLIKNCPSTCMYPFYPIYPWVDTTSPSCQGCRKLLEAIERGEVKIPNAELANKMRKIAEKKREKGEPVLFVVSPVLRADYDEHGNIVFKGIEGIELGVLTPTSNGKVKYEKIGEIKQVREHE